jgi:hypothetical protein
MKYSLLKMVQLILSSMDSDEVDSIDDTTEATQVVDIIETTYYDLASTLDLPDEWDFFELEASGDTTRPTKMTVPSNVSHIEWLQYDNRLSTSTERDLRDLVPLPRKRFFDRMNTLDSADTNVYQYNLLVGTGAFDVRGYNDRMPVYFTTADDNTIIIDNYLATEESTLTGNRTHGYGQLIPVFTRSNTFIPDFAPRQFTLFFNECKSTCFVDLKQIENSKAEQRARKGWVQAHRKDPLVPGGSIYDEIGPNFGRK